MSDKYPGNLIIGPSSGYSVYFNGVNSYLTFTKDLGLTADFTVEFWLYLTAQPTQGFYYMGVTTGPYIATEALKMLIGWPGTWAINPALPMPFINRWNHMALVRTSGTVRLYVNGISTTTASNSSTFGGSQQYGIGAENTGGSIVNKEFYMSSLRVSNIARYSGTSTTSANFGFPSLPLANDANTKFLGLQTATIVDQSASPATITVNGAAAVSNFYLPSNNPAQLNPALGAAVPGVWTLDEAAYYTQTKSWPVYDPSFKGTTLLLHGTGTNGAQNNTFLDSSANNFTITRTGNTTQGSLSPFSQPDGYWSNYFDGTGDYLTLTAGITNFGTSDFTVEYFVYFTAAANSNYQAHIGTSTTGSGIAFGTASNGAISKTMCIYATTSTNTIATGDTALIQNTWNHIVWTRSGTTVRGFLNGVLSAYAISISTNFDETGCGIGANKNGAFAFAGGYITNARVINGAVFPTYSTSSSVLGTTVFYTPTNPLTTTVPSGTVKLLTCQSNRFKDNSTNNFTETVNGNPAVQSFAPFAPAVAYTPSAIGGSGYFDGTSDYLSLTGTAALSPDSVFTFEAWIYFGAIVSNEIIYSSTTTGQLLIGFNTTTSWGIGARAGAFLLTSTTLPVANQWNHIVACRGGTGTNQASLFLNGVRVANGTVSNAFNTTANYQVGYDGGSPTWSGYISGLRLVKADVYGYTNTTITVPTAPPTAIANTALLINFTNAGILDSTAKNVGETINSAQISTAVKRYGPSSMLFDGTSDYVVFPSSTNFELVADFTMECWIYPTTIAGSERGVFGIGTTDPNSNLVRIQASSSKLQFWLGGSNSGGPGAGTKTGIITCTTALVLNTWYHVALVRSGSGTNNVKLYLNGVLDGQGTGTYVITANPCAIGSGYPGSTIETFFGYISDFRVTKNVARYLANFTPPTSQLQDQ